MPVSYYFAVRLNYLHLLPFTLTDLGAFLTKYLSKTIAGVLKSFSIRSLIYKFLLSLEATNALKCGLMDNDSRPYASINVMPL